MRKIIIALCLLPTLALAQTPRVRPHITGDPVQDIKSDIQDLNGNAVGTTLGSATITNALAKPFQDLAAFLSSDAASAIQLSTQIPALKDGEGQQCWIAMSTAGDVFKAHPVPVTFKAMTDVEALRLLQITANKLCVNVHCTQVFSDLGSLAQAASPVPLPIPSLHDLCSKIPQASLTAPITYTPPTPVSPVSPQ